MAGDNLFAILAMIRAELGDEVKDEAWDKICRMLGAEAGGTRVYVPVESWRAEKRIRMDSLAALDAQATSDQLAKILGVSVRHARRLRKMR